MDLVTTYKIEHPPISSANGLQWEEIELSPSEAKPLLDLGIISKSLPSAAELKAAAKLEAEKLAAELEAAAKLEAERKAAANPTK